MFAHVSIGVSDITRAIGFYDPVMETLGYGRLFGDVQEKFMAYGPQESFFVVCEPLNETQQASGGHGAHFCFKADTKQQVDEFYRKAIDLGATCDGEPGLRTEYAADYYAAFILDTDGNKIEALARIK